MKKYKLTKNTKHIGYKTLYQIEALKDFRDVKKGDLGGYIEKESNLSQNDNCWVYDNACVFDNACIFDNACVYDKARVYGNARVYDKARVYDNARVYDKARVFGNTWIINTTKVYGDTMKQYKLRWKKGSLVGVLRTKLDDKTYISYQIDTKCFYISMDTQSEYDIDRNKFKDFKELRVFLDKYYSYNSL